MSAQAETEILERAVTVENDFWSSEAARSMLEFKLSPEDLRRADELAERARGGTLTQEENELFQSYLHICRLVDFMKARALLSLKAQGIH